MKKSISSNFGTPINTHNGATGLEFNTRIYDGQKCCLNKKFSAETISNSK